MEYFLRYFSRALMLLLVLPLTNSARGLVAKWQGDDTSEREGRITLNPFVHLDPIGSLAILLVGFGWSKPMPINPVRMKDYRRGVILISLAGPVTHFLAAIVCDLFYKIIRYSPALRTQLTGITPLWCVCVILSILSSINVCLGVINLLPLPPMDGFQILHQFAGSGFNRWYYSNYRMINQVSMLILLGLFLLPAPVSPLMYLIGWVSSLLDLATAWVPHVFG